MSQNQPTELPLTQIPTARSTSSQQHLPPPHPSLSHSSARRSHFSRHDEALPEEQPPKPAGRRRRDDGVNPNPQDGEKDTHVNDMGRLYEKILTYGTGTRYSIYIIPVAVVLMIPIIVGATQVKGNPKKDPKIGGIRVVWFFTWLEGVWLSFWAMKLVARLIPKIFAYFAGVVSQETKKYARVLENLELMITFLGWVIISFVLYEVLFSTSAAGNTPYAWTTKFKEVLAAILVSTIIFAIEKTFVQLVGVNYHARSFNNRIAESKRSVHLLGLLFDASRTLFPMYGKEFFQEDYIIHSSIEAFVKKGWMGQGDPSKPPDQPKTHGRLYRGIGRLGNKVNSVFGNISAELTGKTALHPKSAHSIVVQCLEMKRAATALAQRLWYSFVTEGNDAMHLSDLLEVLGPDRREEAEECIQMLDPDENGDVSLDEITMKVLELSKDRKAIAKSMHDVSQAIRALDNVLSAVALLLSFFALICFLDTGFHSILSTASSTLISLSFIFSVTAQEFLGSCIFLFVKHPYDIGDRVDIYGPDGINRLEVEQISLLYTAFKRITDLEVIQVPNNILNTLWINNITRSKGMLERIDVYISFDTSFEDIETLRQEMENFVNDEDNKRDFQPQIVLRCLGVGTMDKLQLQLEVRHKSNWSLENIRATRHSKLMCALVLALRKIPIFSPGGGGTPLGDPSNPSYSVAVSDQDAITAREKAAKAANAARLYPLNQPTSDADNGGSQSPLPSPKESGRAEIIAADAMHTIRPSEDPLRDDEKELDNFNVVGAQTGLSPAYEYDGRSPSVKSKSPQGRRRPGLSAPSIASIASRQVSASVASRQVSNDMARIASQSHSPPRNLDEEAQRG